ncbi:zinc finger protein 652-B-like isoform X1 [Gigantopelta aegis]|uniref:zinc finger protein 652-B-like isoform X1 n=1 Tax=Gigantopelta aegis TaxID=1735272 RepID=UPI001B88AFF4|nr:zinc finger protein 652-B-like isoform X1 [Gigantopelta aegis]
MDKQYSIQFFTKFVEAMQKFCRDYIEFEQAVELSGYLSLEIDNYKKERYVLSEMVHSTGDVISESYCVKAFKTMKRLPVRNSNSDSVLRDHTNTRRSSGSRDLQDSPDHQTSSYNSRTATAGYSITSSSPASSHRHNVPSSRRPPSFAAGGPGQMGEGQNRPMNIAMQIQPRQSQFSSSGMSCDDAVIVSVQTGDTVMGSMGRSSDNAVRAQKRNIPQSEESPIHKKDKLDTDIESLYSAATSIVPTSESDVMKDSYSTTPGPSTSQNDLNPSVSEPSQSADGKEHSESIRLPIPESVTIKEENDIVFLDSPQDDSNNDFDGSQMEGGYGMDDSSHGSQGAMGGTAEDQEMNAHTARKTKAHVKLFQSEMQDGSFMKITFNDDDDDDVVDDDDGNDDGGSEKAWAEPKKPTPEEIPETKNDDGPDTSSGSHLTYTNVDRLGVTHVYEKDVETLYVPTSVEDSPEHESIVDRVYRVQVSKCPQCDKTFARKDSLKRHLRSHMGAMSHCEACNRQFWTAAELRSHIAVKHQGERFICNICSRQYQTKYGLKLHIDEHNKQYRFICPFCSKGFNYRSQFEGHMHGHQGLKPFKCTKCSKSYSQSSHLSLHKKVCGLLGKKHGCPQCGKTFKLPKYLKEHQKIHSEPSKLTCPVCGVILSCGGALHNHISRQHPNANLKALKSNANDPKVNPNESKVNLNETKVNLNETKVQATEEKADPSEQEVKPEKTDEKPNEPEVNPDEAEVDSQEIKIKTEPPDDD